MIGALSVRRQEKDLDYLTNSILLSRYIRYSKKIWRERQIVLDAAVPCCGISAVSNSNGFGDEAKCDREQGFQSSLSNT